MPPEPDQLARLLGEKQNFFLPYYHEIVDQYPGGIPAAEVKERVAQQLLERFGIDRVEHKHWYLESKPVG